MLSVKWVLSKIVPKTGLLKILDAKVHVEVFSN